MGTIMDPKPAPPAKAGPPHPGQGEKPSIPMDAPPESGGASGSHRLSDSHSSIDEAVSRSGGVTPEPNPLEESETLQETVKTILIGKPRNLADRSVFQNIS